MGVERQWAVSFSRWRERRQAEFGANPVDKRPGALA
jgi:hypothetical protein